MIPAPWLLHDSVEKASKESVIIDKNCFEMDELKLDQFF
jgi:hypothetical protein